jgi:uncharacterized protein YeaO (DUF488 family)
MKDVAPSSELRKWYGHKPERFAEFARRYRRELANAASHDALEELRDQAARKPTILVTAAKDLEHSGAAVLQGLLASS